MAFQVGCYSSGFGPVGTIDGVCGSLAMRMLAAIQAAKDQQTNSRKPILDQQRDGDIDSSEVEEYLELGEVGMYKTLLSKNRSFSRGEDGDKGYVEADHIPPLDSLRRAEGFPEFHELRSRNPVLHGMVISLREDDRGGRNLLAMQVATEHHRTALSTGSSAGSSAARGVVAQSIARGNVKKMLKEAMIIAHPFASQNIRDHAGRRSSTPIQRIQFTPERTRHYYREAFLRVVHYYYVQQKIILSNEEGQELLEWVLTDGYLDSDSIEYKEILEAVTKS